MTTLIKPRNKTRKVIEPDQYSVNNQKSQMNPENLKCPSCSKIFDGKVFVLHCGHSVCFGCINKQINKQIEDQEYYEAILCCRCCDYKIMVDSRKVYTLTRSGRCMENGLLVAHLCFPRNRIAETMAQEYR